MSVRGYTTLVVLAVSVPVGSVLLRGQGAADSGPRPGTPSAGQVLAGTTNSEAGLWEGGRDHFVQLVGVTGNLLKPGLGPVFNLDNCGGCHAHPALGGSSPAANPQVLVANKMGASNRIPFFVRADGPVRVARFKWNPDGSPNGAVQGLFTIAGRTDAPGCSLAQADFDGAAASGNLALRIPTPLFGLGLIEAIADSTILANKNSNRDAKAAFGISGHENRNSADHSISRFGWKAQEKSLLEFAGEASVTEMGVTNDLFPQKHDDTPECNYNGLPEDTVAARIPDIIPLTFFMRFLDPPRPARDIRSDPGQALFAQVGCALCHTPALTTGKSTSAALRAQAVNLYSDLLVHHMGPTLADDIVQGNAGGDEFRSAPLWGVGQRLFFLHDGRTRDLLEAIEAHSSSTDGNYPDSEANGSVAAFNALSEDDKQRILDFLRSL